MAPFKLTMEEGLCCCALLIRDNPELFRSLPENLEVAIKVAVHIMEKGVQNVVQGSASIARMSGQTEDQPTPAPIHFSTAMSEQPLEPDGPEPRTYTVTELFNAVIEHNIQLPIELPFEETNVHRPGQPLLDEHGIPHVLPYGRNTKEVEAEIKKLKEESDMPSKAFAGLKAKTPAVKKPVVPRDRSIDRYNSDDSSDSDSDDYESDSSGRIPWNHNVIYSKIHPHGPAYFGAVAAAQRAEAEAKAEVIKEKHNALCARIDELQKAGVPTTTGGPRYIDDYGRTLDVALMSTSSSTPAISLPPAKGPPKGPTKARSSKKTMGKGGMEKGNIEGSADGGNLAREAEEDDSDSAYSQDGM